ncbi:hypothetical protein Acsp06_55010 [Actinomycetospora sp. NBRC 106375]|uniref:AAA family ATPase n=1 Tax=Actinomycetospora sp. NBRC 106375 TaxID=3032207 RepID=UPI0024A044CA|nr:AAA family ATPase [Actinomycetospora sp. NBRC 106375]GLZ49316.1 hypothetical protein Acsp06_55010 [Actinomycetospora sp. NBRC 106375]
MTIAPHLGTRPGDRVIGRTRETMLLRVALDAGRHVLLDGPAGAGKTVLLRAACRDRRLVEVDAITVSSAGGLVGRADPLGLLPQRLATRSGVPARAAPEFLVGPLVAAMRSGAVFVLDGADRLSPDAFGVLVPAMSEGELVVPGLGTVRACPGFAIVATASTEDRAGTGAIPAAFLDRTARLRLDHPSGPDARGIVLERVPGTDPRLVARSVAVVRASRRHPDLAIGSSIRGAIDLCAVADALERLAPRTGIRSGSTEDDQRWAARLALSARLYPAAETTRPVEAIIDELWDGVLLGEHRAEPDIGHRLPPSTIVALEQPSAPASSGPPTDDAANDPDGDGNGPGTDAPWDSQTSGARAAAGRGPGGASMGGARDDQQPPEMVLRETEAALASFVGGSSSPGEALDIGASPSRDEVRRLVEAASRVVVRRLDGARTVRAQGTRLASVRYNFRSDDLDLDRTVEELVANPIPAWSDIWVRDRVPRRRGVVLILDVSGSMRGEPLVHAATAAGAATLALAGSDDLAVVAFWRGTAVLRAPGEPVEVLPVVGRVLALRPWGLTDIAGGLTRGAELLERMPTSQRQALVMTDGEANTGAHPLAVAARFSRLDVLATDSSPATLQRCRALASAGHGTCRSYDGLGELPLRLSELLSG